ncbi:MAG TPA: M28 family peptidase [Candidatus Eremiobacteraceae bacterium]|nr:M28 family peptidase [Candidatus Eremiobacteraceae bacterium]
MMRSKTVNCGAMLVALAVAFAGCKSDADTAKKSDAAQPPFMSAVAANPPQLPVDALPSDKTGGFDGKAAYEHVAKMVSFGPRPSGSQALAQTQDYILSQLQSFGCTVETDAFTAQTPAGPIAMKNILVKIQGERPGIILLGTHYDTLKKENFVGADDGGSSTGLMLEMARLLCAKRGRYAVWIAFFDGEEAVQAWSDTDSRYGSREMAAKMAIAGDLKNVRAFLLADIVGGKNARIPREANSAKSLVDLVYSTAVRLGYGSLFVNEEKGADDDHDSFLHRKVDSVDVIGDFINNGYWHTPQDNMEQISAKTLGQVGHVFLEVVKALQAK